MNRINIDNSNIRIENNDTYFIEVDSDINSTIIVNKNIVGINYVLV